MQDVAHGGACIIDLCPVLLHHLNFNGHLANRLAVRPLKEYEVQQKDEQRDPALRATQAGWASSRRLRKTFHLRLQEYWNVHLPRASKSAAIREDYSTYHLRNAKNLAFSAFEFGTHDDLTTALIYQLTAERLTGGRICII